MSANPGGITKSARIMALREVLERWGRLDKTAIDQHVSAKLGCPADALARSLYRDLQELVGTGAVLQFHFSPDGAEIENYDPELHKNVRSEWAVARSESAILGADALEKVGASFVAQPRMTRAFRFESSESSKDLSSEGALSFSFALNTRSFVLRLDLESLPLTLVIARLSEIPVGEKLKALETAFGKRSALLMVPVPGVSSFKGPVQPGHAAIHVASPTRIEVRDLGSKNGTYVEALDPAQANERARLQRLLETATLSVTIGQQEADIRSLKRLDDGIAHLFTPPGLLKISLTFQIVIA